MIIVEAKLFITARTGVLPVCQKGPLVSTKTESSSQSKER